MSKALELIRTLIDGANEYEKKTGNTNPTVYLSRNNLLVIKQALLKAQENARSEEILQKYYQEGITLDSVRALKQERDNYKKILEIIKEKNVDVHWIKIINELEAYNEDKNSWEKELTQEEFNLLKEVLGC